MQDIEIMINRAKHESAHLLILEPGFSPVVQRGEKQTLLAMPGLDVLDTYCLARDLSHDTYRKVKSGLTVQDSAYGCGYICKPLSENAGDWSKGVHIEVQISD